MIGNTAIGSAIRAARTARGWSQQRLAEELSAAAGRGRRGLDRGSVYRWERGTRGPGYWLPYLVHVLHLDLVPDQGDRAGGHPGTALRDTVTRTVELARRDVERRQFLEATSGYALGALAPPDAEAVTRRTRRAGPVNVGRGEVAAVHRMTRTFGDAAAELGGGHARHLVVRYFTEDVAGWLDGRYTEATGRALFGAAAQLVHLAGWMAQDEGNQGVAQRYYAHSYRLAAEAGDAELSATALRGMAAQAIDLGHRAAAVRLSELCVQHARTLDDPRATSYYKAVLAHAAAADGDRHTATAALSASQIAIERSPAASGLTWSSHYSAGSWAHESGIVLAELGDLDAAEEHLRQALDIHGMDRRRSRAKVLADLGGVHLRRGDIGAALDTWGDFVVLAEGIRSVRVTDALTDMRARLARIRHVRGAEELSARAGTLLTTA